MTLSRRDMIRGIGAAIVAGATPKFVPKLLPSGEGRWYGGVDWADGSPITHVEIRDTFVKMGNQCGKSGMVWVLSRRDVHEDGVFIEAARKEIAEKNKRIDEWEEIFG